MSGVPFKLGRDLSVGEVIVIARRATFDPGEFCPQRSDHNGPEELHRWQARAVAVALGPLGPALESKWSPSTSEQALRNLDMQEVGDVIFAPFTVPASPEEGRNDG